MSEVISSAGEVTAAWLTGTLRRAGALESGAVESFDVEGGRGNWSTNVRLHVRYTDDARGDRPERLFLKMVNTDLGDGEWFGPSEVDYYTRDYLDVPDAPLLRCFAAAYSEAAHRYYLLLVDVGETHIVASDRPPTLGYGLALAEGLAALHARWWGAEGIAEAGTAMHAPEHIQRFIGFAQPGARNILEGLADELRPGQVGQIRDLFARHPQALVQRTADANGFTLIHGDAGEYNILIPRQDDRPLYLIDRQPFDWSLTTWLGAYDLAYIMVLDWDPGLRRELEFPVLRHYHEALVARGVNDYPWDRLVEDYRLCVPMAVYIATEYARGGIGGRWQWHYMRMLDRALTACDDLHCANLW